MKSIILLEAFKIKKSYGDKQVFSFHELKIYEGDKIGLIGDNGTGKTTLLQILTGEMSDYTGEVRRYGDIIYFRQFGEYSNLAEKKELKEWEVILKNNNSNLSGGEMARMRLAETFSREHHMAILDEPTTNLDLYGIELLKKKIATFKTLIIVSHDIDLLNEFCTKIIEIKDKTLTFYQGNYNSYQKQAQSVYETKLKEYQIYSDEKIRLEQIYRSKVKQANTIRKKPKNISNSEYKMRNFVCTSKSNSGRQKNMMRSAKAVKARIEQMEFKEKPKEPAQIKLNYNLTNPPKGKYVIRGEGVSFSYGMHEIFCGQNFVIKNGSKVAVLGRNGCGKSTLIDLIFNKTANIKAAPAVKFGILHQTFSNLREDKSIYENVIEESVQNSTSVRIVLARMLFDSNDIHKKISILSGGEKLKVSLAKLMVSDSNVLLLDEPTNYLDINSICALIEILKRYEGTVIFVSHDKNFVNQIATDILFIKNGIIDCYEGNLEEYEINTNSKNCY